MGRNALLSVYDKTGIVEFARALVEGGWRLIASGGTAKALIGAGLKVTDVAELVGGGAILGHRVVTLSREIHAGLLSRDVPEDIAELEKLGIPRIDLVRCDLYPLTAEIAKPEATVESVIEKTDIGGPTLIRSAAKGGRYVICDAADQTPFIGYLREGEPNREAKIAAQRAKAEFTISAYTLASARYHSKGGFDGLVGREVRTCKYGENAWQTPAVHLRTEGDDPLALDRFQLLVGEPSYNNLCDIDRLLQTVTHIAAAFDVNGGEVPGIAVAVKHGNACGAAVSAVPAVALRQMVDGDHRAIMGGLVMTNFVIDVAEAEALLTHGMPKKKDSYESQRRLLDGVIAAGVTEDALALMRRKGDKCRVFVNPMLGRLTRASLDQAPRFRYVRGGMLRQPNYTYVLDLADPALVNGANIDRGTMADLLLAWAVNATSNSNTITIVKNGMLIGNGVGQQDRVGGAELALRRADGCFFGRGAITGAVAASDSFFPFPDGLEALAKAGVKTIFATSGSVNDQMVKDAAREHGVRLLMLPDSKARGFFGH
jgi:phosphoribosylaminoimidazolecarboxamide formyltransferase/IMP cyclohydrolase